jgi:hypothetical protein
MMSFGLRNLRSAQPAIFGGLWEHKKNEQQVRRVDNGGREQAIRRRVCQPLYLSIANRRDAGEVKDGGQPDPPEGH